MRAPGADAVPKQPSSTAPVSPPIRAEESPRGGFNGPDFSLGRLVSNAFESQLDQQDFPEQMTFWQPRRTAWAEPTALVRDHLREPTDDRPCVTVGLPDQAVSAARSLTCGDPLQIRALGGSVLALLAARATDRDQVTVYLPLSAIARPDEVLAVPVTASMAAETTGRDLLILHP